MHPPFAPSPLARAALIVALVGLAPATLTAQTRQSPIRRALYVALGGDPVSHAGTSSVPLAGTIGIEQSRLGSRWSLRLGADYRRQTNDFLGSWRREDFGLGLTARYGRASGAIRPYLLGGVGVAQLRTRVRDARYYVDFDGPLSAPISYDYVRWDVSGTTGVGTDLTVRGVKLFTEARINLYPGWLGNLPYRGLQTTKALYLGVKF